VALKISIKNLVKIYYATMNTLEKREAMCEVDLLNLSPDERTLLNQDINELKDAILSLQEILKQAYDVKTFEEALPKIMKLVNSDPYNRLLFKVAGTGEELPMSSATYTTPSVWRNTTGNDEIN
jgi:5-bromo-4-chloroindolyl phosphate hydrolysis protein